MPNLTPSSPPRRLPLEPYARLALLLLAAAVRFWNLGGASFWYDEAYSWWLATQLTPAESLASSLAEFIPPGAYLLWRGWAQLTGSSEFALRAISALSGIIAVAAAGRAAARLQGRAAARLQGRPAARLQGRPAARAALPFALLLTAIAPPLLWASREMRMYGPLLACTLLGDAALLETLRGRPSHRRAWAWLWGAMALAALYSVVLSGFWLIGHGAFFLAVLALEPEGRDQGARRWAHVRALAPPALVAAVLYLPWLIPALRHLGENRGYWAGTLPLSAFFARTVQGITVFRSTLPPLQAQRLGAMITAFAVVAPVLSMPVLISERMRRAWLLAGPAVLRTPVELLRGAPFSLRRPFPRHLLPALYILAAGLPPLLGLGLVVRTLPKWDLQHTVLFAPPLYITLGVVAARLAPPADSRARARRQPAARPRGPIPLAALWLLRIALLGVVGTLAASSFTLLTHPALAKDDWRGLTAYIRAHQRAGDVVIIRAGCALPVWRYYEGARHGEVCDGVVPEQTRVVPEQTRVVPEQTRVVPLPDDPLLDVTNVLNYANTAPVLSQDLRGASGAWVIGYLHNVADPTDIVGALLEEIGVEEAVPAFHGLELRRYTFEPAPLPADFRYPDVPETTLQPNAELLPGLRLWGVTLPPAGAAGLPADRPLAIRTWWTTETPAAHEGRVYQASLRIIDAAGNVWGQHDAPPGGGDFRPERWPAVTAPEQTRVEPESARAVLGSFDVALLPGTPSGSYTATLILYEIGGPRSEATTLGTLLVGRAESPPPVPESFTRPTQVTGSAALDLIGIRLGSTRVHPCESLTGALFWEVAAPVRLPTRVQVQLGLDQMWLATVHPAGSEASVLNLRPGDRFQTQFRLPIGCRARDTTAPLEVALMMSADAQDILASWTGPEAEIAAGRRFELPTVGSTGAAVTPLEAPFGVRNAEGASMPVATLVGFSLAAGRGQDQQGAEGAAALALPADKPFTLVLYWRAEAETEIPYTVFVHATPPESPGPVAAQHDGWPGSGEKPTPHWIAGEIVADPHPISALPAGTYALRVGLYDPEGRRLVTMEGAAGDDAVIALITVR